MKKALLIFATCVSSVAFAAPSGFAEQNTNNISAVQGFNQNIVERSLADVIKNAYDNEIVTVRGKLVRQLNKDLYEFESKDNTKIAVELDDDKSWNHISKDQLILITGEFERGSHGIKIEVKKAIGISR